MERKRIEIAKDLFQDNFFGIEEIKKFYSSINIKVQDQELPEIPFSFDEMQSKSESHILILCLPNPNAEWSLSINNIRNIYGIDSDLREPCFYNQDWYLKEQFAKNTTVFHSWYLVAKQVNDNTRGKIPSQNSSYPTALLLVFTFFVYYTLRNIILYPNDFVWCSDKDANGDRIYVGRYYDPKRIAKNGFSIHRHLTITSMYGALDF